MTSSTVAGYCIQPMVIETLTDTRLAILRNWRFIDTMRNVRVVRPTCHAGYSRIAERRNLQWLTDNGWLESNIYGDWYLTDKTIAHLQELGDDMERD